MSCLYNRNYIHCKQTQSISLLGVIYSAVSVWTVIKRHLLGLSGLSHHVCTHCGSVIFFPKSCLCQTSKLQFLSTTCRFTLICYGSWTSDLRMPRGHQRSDPRTGRSGCMVPMFQTPSAREKKGGRCSKEQREWSLWTACRFDIPDPFLTLPRRLSVFLIIPAFAGLALNYACSKHTHRLLWALL